MSKGKSIVVVGMQFGDEGKARELDKIISESLKNQSARDNPAASVGAVVRFGGGPNSGHSLKVGHKEMVLHGVPCGIHYPGVILYIGSGCVSNPKKLNIELSEIKNLGIEIESRFKISGNTSLIQPHQVYLDKILCEKTLGTTGNGIGPAYADQAMRVHGELLRNIRFAEYLSNPEFYKNMVKMNLLQVIATFNLTSIDSEELSEEFHNEVMKLSRYLSPDPLYLEKLAASGKNIFFEGAQSIMLDAVTGTVPFTTSSRTLAAAAYTGGDLSLKYHHKTVGVAKAIMSRVGNGPFPSELGGFRSEEYCAVDGGKRYNQKFEASVYNLETLLNSLDAFDIGVALRILGNEYGATTKRPRRMGMLDLVMLKQTCALNAVDELYINKVDCLALFKRTSMPGIPLVVAYELDGKKIDYIPTTTAECRRAMPVIEYLPAFDDISNIRNYNELPSETKEFISYVESKIEVPIHGIGVGPERDQFVWVKEPKR